MWDFGSADLVAPEAIGEPGNRTFRLQIRSGSKAASLWLEKEQLSALALGLQQTIQRTTDPGPGGADDPVPPSNDMPAEPDVDFKVGKLGLGYDEERGMIVIFAYTIEDAESEQPSFTCRATPRLTNEPR